MAKIKTRIIALLAICTLTLLMLTSSLTAFAATANYSSLDSSTPTQEQILPLSDSLYAPTLIIKKYNTAVSYEWRVGYGGDQLVMSPNDFILSEKMGAVFYENAFISTGSNICVPRYCWAKSYSSSNNTYSDITSTRRVVWTSETTNIVYYGEESNYDLVDDFWINDTSITSIPTKYDQKFFIWDHTSSGGHYIKGTIRYNGKLADIEVKVTTIGYRTSSVTIDGVKFYLRTGPNRCSIKVDTAVDISGFYFQFGIA